MGVSVGPNISDRTCTPLRAVPSTAPPSARDGYEAVSASRGGSVHENGLWLSFCESRSPSCYEGVFDTPPDVLAASMPLAQRLAAAMRTALDATGVNILSASGPGSEQSVPHLHIHVVGRRGVSGPVCGVGRSDRDLASAAGLRSAWKRSPEAVPAAPAGVLGGSQVCPVRTAGQRTADETSWPGSRRERPPCSQRSLRC
ncbi:HIT family protein [Streptomyces sp. NPDC050509]|uniref:HIT family protein n=1 Tax=Streptomyces sp. NPDC050509 TaxID=3365620 RepID=UPI0037B3C901